MCAHLCVPVCIHLCAHYMSVCAHPVQVSRHIYVFMCVCLYVCIHLCTCEFCTAYMNIYVCVYVPLCCVGLCVYIGVCISACVLICACVYAHRVFTHMCINVCTHVCTSLHAHACLCMHMRICVHTRFLPPWWALGWRKRRAAGLAPHPQEEHMCTRPHQPPCSGRASGHGPRSGLPPALPTGVYIYVRPGPSHCPAPPHSDSEARWAVCAPD